MRKLNPDAIFSEKACRERYSGLIDGTAMIPIDLDDDPMKRRQELQTYQESRERMRVNEKKQKALDEEKKQYLIQEARVRNAQKAEQIAIARAAKEKVKAERAMQRAAQKQIKYKEAEEIKVRKAQDLIKRKQEAQQKKLATIPDIRNPHTPLKLNALENLKNINQNTPDPRSYLSIVDLKALCANRGLPNTGRTKAEFVDRLKDADDANTVGELKNMCRAKGLNTAGNKIQLRYQLAQQEAFGFASYERNLRIAAEYGDDADDDTDTEDEGEQGGEATSTAL